MSNSIEEVAQARFILAVGTNTTESHPIIGLRVKQAARRGAQLHVVDPRRTELADLAHRHLRLRIGSDTALFNAMAHVIIAEGLHDAAFVAQHTQGFEAFCAHVEDDTPEWAEQITGVPAEQIAATARAYATTRPATILYTLGVTEHTCGVHNVQSLANLALLCGNFGLPSTGVNPLRGQNNVQGAGDMGCLPTDLPGYMKVGNADARHHWARVWGRDVPERPGITKVRAIEHMLQGSIHGAWIFGENTVISDANASKTQRALECLDFLVVQELFLTETARLAHVVLPAACSAETEGTFANSERRVQRVRKAVPPPGEARTDWQIIAAVGERLGLAAPYLTAQDVWDEAARAAPLFAGITYDRLERGGLQWPCPAPDHPGTPYLHAELHAGKQTGHFSLVSWDPHDELPSPEFPLILTTGRRRPAYHTHTQTGRSPAIRALLPEELVEIHPDDAARLQIRDGDHTRVTTRRGSVEVRARVTDRSPPGVIFLSFHFPEAVWTNVLTSDAVDPITETPAFKACAVRVERAAKFARAVSSFVDSRAGDAPALPTPTP